MTVLVGGMRAMGAQSRWRQARASSPTARGALTTDFLRQPHRHVVPLGADGGRTSTTSSTAKSGEAKWTATRVDPGVRLRTPILRAYARGLRPGRRGRKSSCTTSSRHGPRSCTTTCSDSAGRALEVPASGADQIEQGGPGNLGAAFPVPRGPSAGIYVLRAVFRADCAGRADVLTQGAMMPCQILQRPGMGSCPASRGGRRERGWRCGRGTSTPTASAMNPQGHTLWNVPAGARPYLRAAVGKDPSRRPRRVREGPFRPPHRSTAPTRSIFAR